MSLGFFTGDEPIEKLNRGMVGLFKGGGWNLLAVQLLACVCIISWSCMTSFLLLYVSRGNDVIVHFFYVNVIYLAIVTK